MLVTEREPTRGYNDASSVGTRKWAFWEASGQKNRKTILFLLVRRVLVTKRTIFFSGSW